jgi:hypothetical protein
MSRGIRFVSRSKKRISLVGALIVALGASLTAVAYWTTTGTGTGSASSGTLSAPGQPSRTGSGGSVALSWTAATVSGGGTINYHVERSIDPVSTWSDACGTTAGSGTTSTSCTDAPSAGTYRYRVTAIFVTWTATGAVSDAFVVTGGDTTPPYVVSIDRAGSSPTNAGTTDWTVTFSESVTGVDASDFALAASGVSGASITGVSGLGATRTVTTSTGSGDGSLGLNLVDDDSIVDGASNPLGTNSGAGDGSFTGQTYTVDKTAPSVSSVNRKSGSVNPTNAASLDFTVTFSEPVSNVVAARFAVTTSNITGTAPSVSSVTPVGPAPADTWIVSVGTSGAIGANNGSVRLDLTNVGSVQDAATNVLSGTHTGDQSFTFDTTAPAAPISVTLANGGGSGNAFVNNANKSSVNIDVALSAGSSASDTVTLMVHDAGSANSTTVTAAATAGAGTTHFTGIDLSAFNDGTITMSARSQDTLANTSGSTSNTATKDVVAPNAPAAVALTNGGGAGSVFINNANKASVNYSVTLGSGSLSTDSIGLAISDAGNAHTVTPPSAASTSGAGSVNFNGNNLTTLNDGTVTARGTATDLAGNSSGMTPTTNTKDVVAPNAPTAVALTNGGGTGNAFINNANKASINYSVTLGSGSVTADTINLSIADAGNAHTVTPSSASGTSGAGTINFSANNLTTLNDGTITASASATDQAGNSATSSTTSTKDVVAPNAPTTVTLANGGGTGNAFINNVNKASINYSVSLAAGSLTTDSISLSIADAGSAHTLAPPNAAGTSGAGSVSFNANLTTFNDGTVTASSTATDQAGNTSGTTTGTNTKDVVAPTNALTLTAQGNAFLTGTTVYYLGTGASRTLKIQNAVSDSGSGPASSQFATLGGASTGFTFAGSTVSTPVGGPYVSNALIWSSGTTSSPTETVTGADAAGNTAQTVLTFTNDTTTPTNSLTLGSASGAYMAVANGTLFYKSNAAGSFTLVNTVGDAGSGPASATFPAVAASSWTHVADLITTPSGGPYTSTTYSWIATAGAPTAGERSFTSADRVGNVSTTQTLAFTVDNAAPTAGAVNVNGTNASGAGPLTSNSTGTFALTGLTQYTDSGSGLAAPSTLVREEAPLSTDGTGTCGTTWTNPTTISVNRTENSGTGIASGNCYRYTLSATDNVGNSASISTTVRVDATAPSAPTLALSASGSFAFASGTTAYYGASGAASSFTVSATTSDTESGIQRVTFPTLGAGFSGGGADTSGPFSTTYTWTAASTDSGTKNVTATNGIGTLSPNSPFSLVRDATAPAAGALTVNGLAASSGGSSSTASAAFAIGTRADYTEAQSATASGLASSTLTVQSETLTGATCGAPGSGGPFTSPTAISGTTQPAGIVGGFCYLYTLTGTDNVGNAVSVKTTVTLVDAFEVSDPGTQTAGTPFNVTITAKFGGATDTSFNGSQAITFTGPGTAPGGTSPIYPANVSFTNGVGTANITLYRAGATTLTATQGAITGTSPSFTVTPLAATALAFANCSNPASNTTCSGQPISIPNNTSMTFTLQTQDIYGNPSAPTGALTISITSSNSADFAVASGAPATISPPATTSGSVTVSHNNNNTTSTITAHVTSGPAFADAALSVKR